MANKRKYSLFISSTYEDLVSERQAILGVALENDFIPVGMEQFGSHPSDKWELITKMIDECDAYLLVIGGRYGSVDDDGVSWTEREYDYARQKRMPIILLVRKRSSITEDKMDLGKDKYDLEKKLDAFRKRVMGENQNVGFFSDEGSLKYETGKGCHNTKEYLRNSNSGWVKYSDVQSIINEDRKQYSQSNAEVIDALSNAVSVLNQKVLDLDTRTTWHKMEPLSEKDINEIFE